MRKISNVVFIIFLTYSLYAQPRDKLRGIAQKLDEYSNYQSDCNYTFSMPFGNPLSFESLILTHKMPSDSLCGFYYEFNTKESYRGDDFNDLNMYFKNSYYSSYKGEITRTSFTEKPEVFKDRKAQAGIIPAVHRSPQLFNLTPYQIAKKIIEFINDPNSKIIQMPDTVVMKETCLRFILESARDVVDHFSKQTIPLITSLELCFNKSQNYLVYYRNDVKNSSMPSFQKAFFSNTKINQFLPENYFSEEQLFHNDLKKTNISKIAANPENIVGQKAPDWKLPILNSNGKLSNSDLLGKYILIEFTATWCGYCIEAAEMMNRLEDKFGKSQNIALLSIFSSKIDTEEGIQKFVEKNKLKSKILYSAANVGEDFQVFSYPNFIIVSPKGKVFMNFQGYSSTIEKNITNILEELSE